MLRRYFSLIGLVSLTTLVTCFVLPALISSASTIAVLFGILVAVIYAPLFWWWAKKLHGSFKGSTHA